MNLTFYKYQGTGNDFIIIDDREETFDVNNHSLIHFLCDRKFGIGSDGLILIRKHPKLDFAMIFFNPDASKSFCGNGSRCAVQFVTDQKMFPLHLFSFEAIDGNHTGISENGKVTVSVNNVKECVAEGNDYFLHTGSPHFIKYVNDLDKTEIIEEGRRIRYSEKYLPGGTNVNFVETENDHIKVRTYERGVENETLSCGSGVTASALSFALKKNCPSPVKVITKGGELEVRFKREGNSFSEITLTGPAQFVYKGEINV